MKQKELKFFINLAKLVADQSNAVRLKVGGVAVDQKGNIICTGYNGDIKGGSNIIESRVYSGQDPPSEMRIYDRYDSSQRIAYRLETNRDTIHAEQNIIAHAARRGISIEGSTFFMTHSPCNHCTALMIQSGVSEVVFAEKFRTFEETFEKYSKFIKIVQFEKEIS